jgi:hypothetical protein
VTQSFRLQKRFGSPSARRSEHRCNAPLNEKERQPTALSHATLHACSDGTAAGAVGSATPSSQATMREPALAYTWSSSSGLQKAHERHLHHVQWWRASAKLQNPWHSATVLSCGCEVEHASPARSAAVAMMRAAGCALTDDTPAAVPALAPPRRPYLPNGACMPKTTKVFSAHPPNQHTQPPANERFPPKRVNFPPPVPWRSVYCNTVVLYPCAL